MWCTPWSGWATCGRKKKKKGTDAFPDGIRPLFPNAHLCYTSAALLGRAQHTLDVPLPPLVTTEAARTTCETGKGRDWERMSFFFFGIVFCLSVIANDGKHKNKKAAGLSFALMMSASAKRHARRRATHAHVHHKRCVIDSRRTILVRYALSLFAC